MICKILTINFILFITSIKAITLPVWYQAPRFWGEPRLIKDHLYWPEFFIRVGSKDFALDHNGCQTALKDLLPSHISNDHKKIGFASPIDTFFKDFKNEIKQLLLNDLSTSRNLFNREKLESMIDSVGFKHSSERVIFRIICVELWYKNFIDA